MDDFHVEQIQDLCKRVLDSRKDYVPIEINTIGKFDSTKPHNAFVSLLKYSGDKKRTDFAFKYIPIWNYCECSKDVHVVQYFKQLDPQKKNLYTATWKLMVRQDSILAVRNNPKYQVSTNNNYKFYVVDGSEYQQDKGCHLREISSKRAYDLARLHSQLMEEQK